MAKEMGLNPLSLIKNIPAKDQLWKAPVKKWLHEIYEDRKAKSEKKADLSKTKVRLTIGIKSNPDSDSSPLPLSESPIPRFDRLE
jgi:hypothetical protein